MTIFKKVLAFALLAGMLGGCADMSARQKNAAAGAAIGGIIGHGVDGMSSSRK